MVQKIMTDLSVKHPKTVIIFSIIVTMIFMAAIPSLKTDTDPVHMLPADNPAVVLYNNIKSEFQLYDFIGVGIRSKDGSSLFTKEKLTSIHKITKEILGITDSENPSDPDLIVREDLISISSTDDIIKNDKGELMVVPLMDTPPADDKEAAYILDRVNKNPMFAGKLVSKDGSLIGIFIPLHKGKKERSFYIGERIKEIVNNHLGSNEEFFIAGLPLAESTFGTEMFIQMGAYAPMAGLVILLLMLYFFRSFKVVLAPMILGIMMVTWSMGGLIYSGNVVHIMSSMIPIFLLPIAVLDSIHILSNLGDKINKYPTREEAVRSTIKELFNPMLYTSVTTMVGFVSLSTTGIPPVVVFGVTIGVGVFLSWVMSMLFIPAYTMLLSEKTIRTFAGKSSKSSIVEIVHIFRKIAEKRAGIVITLAAIIFIISIVGLNYIEVNDNPVRWFKSDHFIRKADDAMNEKLAGTYIANLHFSINIDEAATPVEEEDEFSEEETEELSIREPEIINYIYKTGEFLKTLKTIDGKTAVGSVTSITDVLQKIGEEALGDNSIPDTKEKVSQYIFLFESGDIKKGKDLWKLIKPVNANASQMWVHFKTGDNQIMEKVMSRLNDFMKENPAPVLKDSNGKDIPLKVSWSGLMHINNIWQQEMVAGMGKSLAGSFIIVFFMMTFLFRSPKWGLIAMLPLSLTIAVIYGIIGFTGKFYDMPIAVLSSLTLGLSIDFAIHFIEHARATNKKFNDKEKTLKEMFEGTAQAIWLNVLVISIGFGPLFFAGLVPYITVGSFFFAIMLVSGITTLILLPSIVRLGKKLPGFTK